MKLISWNVNGIRACVNKGFKEFFKETNADIFCIQETKCQPDQIELEFDGYKSYYNSAEKKGYSGTAIYTKKVPLSVSYGIGIDEHDKEGRVITLEFDNYYKNLEVVSLKELGKRTGYISKSKRVVEVKNGEIIRDWPSSRKAAKELYISYQTVSDYCNNKVESPMFNLMWEDDYFDEVLEPFKWEHKKRKEKKK